MTLEEILQEADQAKVAQDYVKAVQFYLHAVQLCEKDESKLEQLALCLQELADIYEENGLLSEAIVIYQKLIDIGEQTLGSEHEDVIATIAKLARALDANRQYEESDKVFKLATSKAEKVLGIGHPVTQQIRDEYFEALADRQVIEKDKARHGLTLEPASQANMGNASNIAPLSPSISESNQNKGRADETIPVKKYSGQKQSKKIKKLRYAAESIEEQAGGLLKAHNLPHRWRDIFYIFSVVLCVSAIVIALSKMYVPKDEQESNLVAQRLIEKGLFRSVDEVNGINFIDNKYAVFINDVQHRKIRYYLLKGGVRDLWDMLISVAGRKESWYQLRQDELLTEDGNIYYANGAPEFLIVKKMQALADFAQHYYVMNGCYPDKTEKLKDVPGLTYINPINNQPNAPVIKRLSATYTRDAIFPGVKVDASVNDCYMYLKSGGLWRDESAGTPGKINALALFTSQRCADGYKVTEFYINGFDRYGNLITGGKPETFYAIGLYQGKKLYDIAQEHEQELERISVHTPEKIYVVPGNSVDLHFSRQCGYSILNGWIVLSFLAWIFLESKKRKEEPMRTIQPIEIVFLLSLLVRGYIALVHLIP